MTPAASNRAGSYAVLAGGVLSVSVSGLIAHRALAESTPLMLAAWRMGAASLFFLGVHLARGRSQHSLSIPLPGERARLVAAGIVLAIHFLVWFASLTLTSVSVATLLVCTTPLWTAIGQIGLRRQMAGLIFWIAFVVAIVGLILIVHPSGPTGGAARAHFWGDVLALAGGLMYSLYLLAIDGLQQHSSATIVTWTYTVAGVVLWLVAFAFGHPTLRYTAPVWEAIALLTIVPQIVGHTLISHALNFFQAHVVAFAVLAEPVITASLAVVLIHDVITPVMIAGGALVLAAMGAVLATSQSKSSMQDIEDI